jgi:ankyrin repeat protein
MRNRRIKRVKVLVFLMFFLLLLVNMCQLNTEAKQLKTTSKKSSQKVLKQKLNYLMALIEKKETKRVEELISKYPEIVNMKNIYGNKPIFWAANVGNREIVRILALAGANINEYSEDFDTPLRAAASHGNREIVEELISLGADINATTTGGATALMYAAEFEKLDVVKFLLSAKARYDIKDTYGYSAFLSAAETGNTALINEFLKLPIDVNEETKDGDTALILVAGTGNDEIVKTLVDRGAVIDHIGFLGRTPLTAAISSKKYATAKLLLDLGAKPDLVIDTYTAPLHHVIDPNGDVEKEVELIKLLAVNKTIINLQNPVSKKTVLFDAVENKKFEAVKILLERGADPNIRDRRGRTALRYAKYAVYAKDEKIAKLLQEYGAVE